MNINHKSMMLDDGSKPCSHTALLELLSELKIEHKTVSHDAMFTVAQSKSLRETDPHGGYTKNLFMRNKKGAMWLITCTEDRRINLKTLAAAMGYTGSNGRFSFASEDRLGRHLGVSPGAVSPLALINDTGNLVQFAIDISLLDHKVVHLHPLDNHYTTTISVKDLIQFAEHTGHKPAQLEFDPCGGVSRFSTAERST
jgi:Ala-tRNA(Pro) deacylase